MRKLVALALLALPFVACSDSSDGPSEAPLDSDGAEVRDTVVVRDSLEIRVHDSTKVNYVDSVNIVDRINVIDSVNIIDSIRIIDSLVITDSLNIIDSVEIRDSVAVRDVEYYLGECSSAKAGAVETAVIGESERDFVCDRSTLLWRAAGPVDINNKYIAESDVKTFTPVDSVYKNLSEGEKLIIVLRHAERGDDYSMRASLSSNGFNQSKSVGESLVGETPIYYGASQFTRAHQTCSYIAKGRGDADTLADTLASLNDYWFVKDSALYKKYKDEHDGGWKVSSKWAFENAYADAFYNLEERSTELLDDILLPALEKSGKDVGLFVSHDIVMVPLVIYVSQKNINLKYYESTSDHWLNYLGGIAVVFKPDGSRVFYAVKGLSKATM